MDRFIGMAVFAKVVEGKSFAAAARHFGLSPAMVSKHIQMLEERIGARLLNRTTRRVNPTEVGQGYYERCVRILADVEEADRAAENLQATPRGVLRVNAPFTFAIAHVVPAIPKYLGEYPEVTIDLTLNDHYVDLIEDGFDLAIRIGSLRDSSLIARKLAPIRLVLCASPHYLDQHGVPQTPQDLTEHNCLIYTYSTARGEWRFTDADGRETAINVSGNFLANNGDALRILALDGAGVVLSPTFMVGDAIKAGRLVRLLPDHRTPEVALYAVYPHSRYLSTKVRTFVDFLAARFDHHPAWDR